MRTPGWRARDGGTEEAFKKTFGKWRNSLLPIVIYLSLRLRDGPDREIWNAADVELQVDREGGRNLCRRLRRRQVKVGFVRRKIDMLLS